MPSSEHESRPTWFGTGASRWRLHRSSPHPVLLPPSPTAAGEGLHARVAAPHLSIHLGPIQILDSKHHNRARGGGGPGQLRRYMASIAYVDTVWGVGAVEVENVGRRGAPAAERDGGAVMRKREGRGRHGGDRASPHPAPSPRAVLGELASHPPASWAHRATVVLLPAFPSSAPRRTCGGSGERGVCVKLAAVKGRRRWMCRRWGAPSRGRGALATRRWGEVKHTWSTKRWTGAGVAEVQGGVGVDGENSPSAAQVHDAGDDCDYWSRDVGAEASRPRESKRGARDLGQWSVLVHRRPTPLARRQITTVLQKTEDLGGGRQRQATIWFNPSARLDHTVRGSSTPAFRPRSVFSPHLPPLAPLTHTHRCGSSHTSRRSGVDARDAPLEFADSRQNALKAARTLRTADQVSPATRCGGGRMLDGASAEGKRVTSRGRPANEGVAVEAHQDPKAGPEEREARRSRGGDDEDSGAQPAEEGTREGRVAFASYRWEMESEREETPTYSMSARCSQTESSSDNRQNLRLRTKRFMRPLQNYVGAAKAFKTLYRPRKRQSTARSGVPSEQAAAAAASSDWVNENARFETEHDITIDEVMLSARPIPGDQSATLPVGTFAKGMGAVNVIRGRVRPYRLERLQRRERVNSFTGPYIRYCNVIFRGPGLNEPSRSPAPFPFLPVGVAFAAAPAQEI
ncbi:hypothetical protein B0H14DRAFT_3170674 [Mycena olivaceomarginata]|nr:hypothetical protein B0H14DRAFT_3170674 [Mycena olivaceomarginata]